VSVSPKSRSTGIRDIDYLMAAAALDAIKNSAIERIDAIYVGNVSAEVMQYQAQLGAVASEQLGLIGVPSIRVEAADASGAAALREAYMAIASGIDKGSPSYRRRETLRRHAGRNYEHHVDVR